MHSVGRRDDDDGLVGYGRRQQQQQQHPLRQAVPAAAAAAPIDARLMTTETQRAIDAVRFIAAHLKSEDDYAEVNMDSGGLVVYIYCFYYDGVSDKSDPIESLSTSPLLTLLSPRSFAVR